MRKKIVKIGTSAGIILTKPEREIHNLKIGDVIEIPDELIKKIDDESKNQEKPFVQDLDIGDEPVLKKLDSSKPSEAQS